MAKERPDQTLRLTAPVMNFIGVVLGIAAAYFLTIQSLKTDLADKAEAAVVQSLDKKLAGFEVLLKEGVVGKEQFYKFANEMEARLIRIEGHLTGGSGE